VFICVSLFLRSAAADKKKKPADLSAGFFRANLRKTFFTLI
jgi:hypothetical protein